VKKKKTSSLLHSESAEKPEEGSEDGEGLQTIAASDGDSSSSSDSSVEGKTNEVEQVVQAESSSDQSDDDFDFKSSAAKVGTLLDSLHCDERLGIMTELNTFYAGRRAHVDEDIKELGGMDSDFHVREEDTKNSMQVMLLRFEEKQMREVKVLVKCGKTLNLGARNMLKQRRQFAKKAKKTNFKAEVRKKRVAIQCEGEDGEEWKDEEEERPNSQQSEGGSWQGDAAEERDNQYEKRRISNDGAGGEDEDSKKDPGSPKIADDPDVKKALAGKLKAIDIDGARTKLKEMHDAPQKVLTLLNQDDPPAGEILSVLARVQEGQLELESMAKLAVNACQVSKAALDHITSEKGDSEVDPAVAQLLEEVRFGIFGENGEDLLTGPDPEELEEECRTLENLIAKQEKDIEIVKKQRDRPTKVRDSEGEGKDQDAGSDEEVEVKPVMHKSVLRDGRVEAAQAAIARQRTMEHLAEETANAAAAAKATKKMGTATTRQLGAGGGDGQKDSDSEEETAEPGKSQQLVSESSAKDDGAVSVMSNKQVQGILEKIKDKEVKLIKAKEVHQRMKKESALLRYCAKMSDEGLEAILEGFHPEDAGGDSESSCGSDDEKPKGKDKGKALKAGKAPKDKGKNAKDMRGGKEDEPEPEASESSVIGDDSSDGSKRKGKNKETEKGKEPEKQSYQQQVMSFNDKKLEEAEAEVKKRIQDLQRDIAKDTDGIKAEKKKQTGLKKDIKKLKGNYKVMVKQHKGAPSTLEALDRQLTQLNEGETQLNTQVEGLREELVKQTQLLEKAQEEARHAHMDSKDAHSHRGPLRSHGHQANTTTGAIAAVDEPAPGAHAPSTPASPVSPMSPVSPLSPVSPWGPPGAEQTAFQERGRRFSELGRRPSALGSSSISSALASPSNPSSPKASTSAALPSALVSALAALPSTSEEGPPPASAAMIAEAIASAAEATAAEAPKLAPKIEKSKTLRFSQEDAEVSSVTATPGMQDAPDELASKKTTGEAARKLQFSTPETIEVADAENKSSQQDASRKSVDRRKSVAPTDQETVKHEDLAELVRLQCHNEELKTEIDDMMGKMQQLRTAMKRGKSSVMNSESIRQIVGGPLSAEEVAPPPEYAALKKEVRTKQNEVRILRKKWWTDHKDLDILAEKVKHHVHLEGAEEEPPSTLSTKELAPEMPQNWKSNTRRTLQGGADLSAKLAQTFEGGMAGRHIDANPHTDDHHQARRAPPGGVGALMASATLRPKGTNNAHAAAEMPGESDEHKMALQAEGVRGRFHGVRKSLALNKHTMKDLLGDDEGKDIDLHDRTTPEPESPRNGKSQHPLGQQRKSVVVREGSPLDLRKLKISQEEKSRFD